MNNSKFNEGNITIGFDNEWQDLVDEINAKITKDGNVETIIIFTGLVEHNINHPMTTLYKEYHEPDDNLETTIQRLSVITCPTKKLEQAILDFQKLKIVEGMADSRSCVGPGLRSMNNYFYNDTTGELQVCLAWVS
uniref:Uncharacterized protein n=1 Tax=Marseillevirus LCMAC201 TaxID=2506605 RepID=A0A481YW99_9VIRU|nr:MAG: hypothetical protein LCMAC201_03090 [Marseillevirus LCMAC201]